MNQYRRIVSYLYKYENGQKGENTGFVRIDTREKGIRLYLRIKDLRMMDEKRLKIYFYFHKEKQLQLIFVDEFLCVRGNCEYKNMIFPDFTDSDLEKMSGVMILDSRGLLYGSCWDEREIRENMIPDEIFYSVNREMEHEEKDLVEEGIIGATEERDLEEEDVCEEGEGEPEEELSKAESPLLSGYPLIKLHNPEGTIYPVRIQMGDIPMLPSTEWKLVDNAFLKQAYEREQHLLLGKIQMSSEKEIWVLGVPGIYDNREKYLAGIFGFTDYIPVEEVEYKTGGKGYWIRQIQAVES